MAASEDLEITQGATFAFVLRWEKLPVVYKPISGITKAAPCVVTAVSHGVPDGWRVAVVSTRGMDQLKATKKPPKDSEYHRATVLTGSTIELNNVNAADFSAYVSGGYLQYYTPADLAGFTARMSIKDRVGGTELVSLTTENDGIVIDAAAYTITLNIAAVATAALSAGARVYDLEMVSPDGVVTPLMYGAATVSTEVTT
jgi:hypothetical protein